MASWSIKETSLKRVLARVPIKNSDDYYANYLALQGIAQIIESIALLKKVDSNSRTEGAS